MATNFPTSLDALANPLPNNTLDSPSHSTQHTNLNDAVEALQAKVGVNSSAVATSHDKILTLKANIANPTFTGTVTFTGGVSSPTFTGAHSGSGAALTGIPNSATTARSDNTVPSTIVTRDASGDFAAGTITATSFVGALIGNANTATTAATVTTNANLTGGVTSLGNVATVVTNANLTGGVTSVGNATTVVTNANLTGDVTSVGNATTVVTNANLTGPITSVGNVTTISTSAVTNAQLGANAVTSGKIDNGAVLGRKINKNINNFNGATYTVVDSDCILTHYGSTISYVTLPSASTYTGRPLLFRQIGSAGIISDTTNVIPLSSNSPSSGNIGRPYGPVITSQTQGAWAELVSNGTNWVIVSSSENIV
jgi:hypothetical protein